MKTLLALVLAGVVMCGSAAAFACDKHGGDAAGSGEAATTAASGEAKATDGAGAEGEAAPEAPEAAESDNKKKTKKSKKACASKGPCSTEKDGSCCAGKKAS
jgi:hypothetical protein